MSFSVPEAVAHIVDLAVGTRLDNYHDMRMPEISDRAALAIELAPLLEAFHENAEPTLTADLFELFETMYGMEPGWADEYGEDDDLEAYRVLAGASGYEVHEALIDLWAAAQ